MEHPISVLWILSCRGCRGKKLKQVKAVCHVCLRMLGQQLRIFEICGQPPSLTASHGYLWAWAMHGPKARFTLARCQSPYLRISLGMVASLHDQRLPGQKNTGKSHILSEHLWFPLDVPLNPPHSCQISAIMPQLALQPASPGWASP